MINCFIFFYRNSILLTTIKEIDIVFRIIIKTTVKLKKLCKLLIGMF